MEGSVYDSLFQTALDKRARFSFDEAVAACFPDMIRRSVPGYGQMLATLPLLVRRHCAHRQRDERGNKISRVYDLGTSLGAVSFALAQNFAPDELRICAVDVSKPMIDKAQAVLQESYPKHAIDFVVADICDFALQPCDAIALNLTLQFLPPDRRLEVLQKCYQSLAPGGILILTEKTHAPSEQDDAWLVERYYDFKRANGYSDLQISAKRDALENVLITDTLQTHHERLKQAGFGRVLTWFLFLNFASVVAFKE